MRAALDFAAPIQLFQTASESRCQPAEIRHLFMMNALYSIELEPFGKTLKVEWGTSLQDILFSFGLEFPCGGRGICNGCRVKVLRGVVPVTPDHQQNLSPEELQEGWRLACRINVNTDLAVEFAQWKTVILTDESRLEFTPSDGLGVAVDLGTTTLVAQLLDLATGQILAVKTDLNPQARYGADVMTRIQYAVHPEGRTKLTSLIRRKINYLISGLLAFAAFDDNNLTEVVIVGNTVMHHLFCDIDVTPLSHYPFEPEQDGLQVFHARDLDWEILTNPTVIFLPCLGGFIGSDVLAGILATKMAQSEPLIGLIDLGTNGEIVFGNRNRIICASAAAGPAFEGARISQGMRAAAGAIWKVNSDGEHLSCDVLGGVSPRGICGSGLVDAVACGLDLHQIKSNGRFSSGRGEWRIGDRVGLTQCDIRELQLAKGAMAAGVRILLQELGVSAVDVANIYIAGAFGNYIEIASAKRIGLFVFPAEKMHPSGNTALLGAKISLFSTEGGRAYEALRQKVEHISLATDPNFQDIFVEEMGFPIDGT